MKGIVFLKRAAKVTVLPPLPTRHLQWQRSASSASSPSATVFLVRHGQTHANRDRLIDGQTDSVLTDLGRRQAAAAGSALRDVHFGLAVASALPRAVATAENVLGQNATFSGRVETCKLLRERDFGALDRIPTAEYMAHPEFDGWAGNFTPAGAETREEVRGRAFHQLGNIPAPAVEQ